MYRPPLGRLDCFTSISAGLTLDTSSSRDVIDSNAWCIDVVKEELSVGNCGRLEFEFEFDMVGGIAQ